MARSDPPLSVRLSTRFSSVADDGDLGVSVMVELVEAVEEEVKVRRVEESSMGSLNVRRDEDDETISDAGSDLEVVEFLDLNVPDVNRCVIPRGGEIAEMNVLLWFGR